MTDDIFSKTAQVRPFVPRDYEPLCAACESDNHTVVAPTHIVEKEGRIVGYLSLGAIPMVLLWLDTKHVKALDTIIVVQTYENLVRAMGNVAICVPCAKDSPFHGMMVKHGFVEVKEMSFFIKNLI